MKQQPCVRQHVLRAAAVVLEVLFGVLWVRPALVKGLTSQTLPEREGSYTLYLPIASLDGDPTEPRRTPPPIDWPEPVAPLDPYVQAARLGRGINLANALEAPREGEWGVTLKEEYFPIIAQAGFDTVRVPIRWSAHALVDPPYTIDEGFFERIDWVIDNATAQGLNVVINMHNYDGIVESPSQHEARFLAMWRQIATRYHDRPSSLYLELLNEPYDKLSADRWNNLLVKAMIVIREVDGVHTIVVDSAEWASAHALAELKIPPNAVGATNVICSFHLYKPQLFTFQGAEWMGGEYQTLGVQWPGPPEHTLTPSDGTQDVAWTAQWFEHYNTQSYEFNPAGPEPVLRELDQAVAYGKELGCPLWLGEFGAYRRADMESRVNWTAFVREEAEKRGLPWAYWEFGAGFGIYDKDDEAWREELLRALIP